MPSRSSPREPSTLEKSYQEAAILFKYVYGKLDKPVPLWINDGSKNRWFQNHKIVPVLCTLIRTFTGDEMEEIVYNGHCAESRRLADWWDKNLEADNVREEIEFHNKKNAMLKKSAAAKLTQEERTALGI